MENEEKVGVIGLGAVGKAVKHAFEYYYSCCGYDIKEGYPWENILKTSLVFICVPTPEGPDGRLDCGCVDEVLLRLSMSSYKGLVVIKSTIGIGFMEKVVKNYPYLRLVYMPEFLREKSNFTWFVCPDRLVISGADKDVEEVLNYFLWVEDAPILKMSHRDAEIGKLAHNAYIALKVSFTNEMEKICQEHDADPESVMGVIWADRRVKSKEHLRPFLGPYSGKCVPKDTRELIFASDNPILLRATEEVNDKIISKKTFSELQRSENNLEKAILK